MFEKLIAVVSIEEKPVPEETTPTTTEVESQTLPEPEPVTQTIPEPATEHILTGDKEKNNSFNNSAMETNQLVI